MLSCQCLEFAPVLDNNNHDLVSCACKLLCFLFSFAFFKAYLQKISLSTLKSMNCDIMCL